MARIVAVTGANGFLGSHLAEALNTLGFTVRCLVRKTSNLENLNGLDLEYHYGELSKGEGLAEFLRDADFVIHLAAQTVGLNREELRAPNIDAVSFLIHGIQTYAPNLKKCVFISSQEAILPSQTDQPLKEDDVAEPFTDYGWSKYQAEQLFTNGNLQFPWIILRPGPVYGPRDKDFFMLFSSLHRGIEPRMMFSSSISFVYVGNVVHYILKAMESQITNNIFFVSDGVAMESRSFAALISLAQQRKTIFLPVFKLFLFLASLIGNLRMKLFKQRSILNLQKYRMMTQRNLSVDPAKLQSIFGPPEYTTEQGIELTHRWYESQGWYNS